MILPSVFVEIPSQNINLTTIKPASASRHGEIKAEPPIKSEIDHTQHAQLSAIAASVTASAKPTEALRSIPSTSAAACEPAKLTANLITARPKVKCLKCDKCPFMSINQQGYEEHVRSVHASSTGSVTATSRSYRNKLLCPGCENVFYSKMSLKIHLVNDHQMNRADIKQLLDSVLMKSHTVAVVAEPPAQVMPVDMVPVQFAEIGSTAKRAEPQKIYLKNVEVLQNPKFEAHRFNAAAIVAAAPPAPQHMGPMNLTTVEFDGSSDEPPNTMLAIDGSYEVPSAMLRFDSIVGDSIFQQPNIEPISTFSFVSPAMSAQTSVGLNIAGRSDSVLFNAISPMTSAASMADDSSASARPDSGNSMEFCESAHHAWTATAAAAANTNVNYVEYSPTMNLSTMSGDGPAMPSAAIAKSEQKKIFIKNIDILMKPILHLRTVDEVNLLINKPNEHSTFSQIDNITLNEDDYQYMLNDNTNDYNGIIPDYLNPSISDLMFADEYRTELNLPEFHSNSNSSTNVHNGNTDSSSCSHAVDANCTNISSNANIATDLSYSIINLDSDQAFATTASSNVPTFYASDYEHSVPIEQRSLHCSGSLMANAQTPSIVSYADPFAANDADNVDDGDSGADSGGFLCPNGLFYGDGGKFLPAAPAAKMLDTNVDFMFVSPDEIIDPANVILDLTNDEVEQILDDNLISAQDLDVIGGATSRLAPEIQSCKRLPRINIATNLTKAFAEATGELDGKLPGDGDAVDHIMPIDAEHTGDGLLDELAAESVDADQASGACVPSDEDAGAKRKAGRARGARQMDGGVDSRTQTVALKCSVGKCGMRFGRKSTLDVHQQCHGPDPDDIRCPKCEDGGAGGDGAASSPSNRNWNWNTLHTHLWREHNIDMELYGCPHCAFKTPILSRLKNTHMKIHSDSRDFACDLCSKTFKNARQMKNHRRIHTRSQAPTISQCKYCGQSFYSAKHLKEHLLTHSESLNDRPSSSAHPCDVCHETFRSRQKLRVHHQTLHCDDKRFVCEFGGCGYKSNDHNAMRRHRLMHTKEAKYKCPVCPFQCIQSTNYKNHIMKKHPDAARELMYICERCNFVTVNKRMYELHCLNHGIQRQSSVDLG